jgi:hypothetical protein
LALAGWAKAGPKPCETAFFKVAVPKLEVLEQPQFVFIKKIYLEVD